MFVTVFLVGLILLNIILSIKLLARSANPPYVRLEQQLENVRKDIERSEEGLRQEFQRQRDDMQQTFKHFNEGLFSRLAENHVAYKSQLDIFSQQLTSLTQMNAQKLEAVRDTVEKQLQRLAQDNGEKLDQMRATVDEKLHATLEKRLGESFKIVSDRLEKVHQGLGEMQHLASGVGDLKKVLSNVKTRGTWGEVQLGNLLEQILTPQQYEKNVITKKGSRDSVEFAIKLPGRDKDPVFLPIDAKFPIEDYQRLLEAQDNNDFVVMEECGKDLERRLKGEAKKIKDKYIDPPQTTDFAILYLITEGLYSEVLRRPGLSEVLQQDHRVIIAGPTTIVALLNSLQMGFRTLAVEQRASEVWTLLGAVKTEFGKFGGMLERTHKQLQAVSNTIETASRKSRTIERRLKNVQELPEQQVDASKSISLDELV